MIPIKACERDGDKMCASFELHQKQFSFAEVNSEAEKIGAALLSLGLKPGDNIAIWGPNQPEESFDKNFPKFQNRKYKNFENILKTRMKVAYNKMGSSKGGNATGQYQPIIYCT